MGYKDLTGKTFGSLTPIEIVGTHEKYKDKLWLCRCQCGKTSVVRSVALSSGSIKSCGCSKAYKDITGKRYGRLVALEKDPSTTKNYWKVKCDCGNLRTVSFHNLQNGDTKSCGCLRKEVAKSRTGAKNQNWKGGGDPASLKQRTSSLYKNWRKLVLDRDNYCCLKCKSKSNLVAHHKRSFASNPKLRLDVKNGATLCTKCHKAFHKRYGLTNNNTQQFTAFLKLKI